VALSENELKRAEDGGEPGSAAAAARRAHEMGLGPGGWVPDGGLMRRRFLMQSW
jgi:hypothetical protein